MGMVTGNELVARALKVQEVDMFFYIMGGPMMGVELATMAHGIRGIDVRHEQAAAMMAHAYARIRNRPGVCMAASGPATTNLVTGVGHAWGDCVPLVALGGASPTTLDGRGAFQEVDQLSIMRPVTKWAERAHHTKRIPELIARAFDEAGSGKPGPAYIDLPGDVLYAEVDETTVEWPEAPSERVKHRPAATPQAVSDIVELLRRAERPAIISGGGILWAGAEGEYQAFVEATGIPFYTTPQARGVVPEDHEYCYLTARSTAFREADVILVLGTRLNYVIGHAEAPRFNPEAKLVRIDIDPEEIASSRRLDVGVVADAKVALTQLLDAVKGVITPEIYRTWRERLAGRNSGKSGEQEQWLASTDTPVHPLKLCAEVREFMDRDAILVVDGQEILNYGRQSIPTHVPRHRINSGVWGTMGIGLPCGVGAKAAKPQAQVIVLHGDGSFGFNAMELDTAVRHNLPLLVIISLNGGWTGDPEHEKPGRDLGYTRYDKMAEALGCYAEYVESPEEIRGALDRAKAEVEKGRVAVVNVKTDYRARASTAAFTSYAT